MAVEQVLLEDGASFLLLEDGLSALLLETSDADTGVSETPTGLKPAGRASKGKRRRRIELDGRLYEVAERDVPALLEAVLRSTKPPGTAEVIEEEEAVEEAAEVESHDADEQSPEPMSVDLLVERFAFLQQDLARQAEQDVLRMLDRVVRRVLAEIEDEDDALTALLLA